MKTNYDEMTYTATLSVSGFGRDEEKIKFKGGSQILNTVIHGDALEVIGRLPKVDIVVTSPPYAEQRKNQYESVSSKAYPWWTVMWMSEVKKILKPNGSVFINIRPHIKNGEISDYVLKTILALREDGWKQCEDILWYKPDSPPLGSINRPRRAWEAIHWFSLTGSPYVDTKANGTSSDRIGFESNKFEHGGKSHIHAGQNNAIKGTARSADVIVCGTSKIEKGIDHEAIYPIQVPNYLIKLGCPAGGTVLDPFCGSGTTLLSAIENGMNYLGIDNMLKHVMTSRERVGTHKYPIGLVEQLMF